MGKSKLIHPYGTGFMLNMDELHKQQLLINHLKHIIMKTQNKNNLRFGKSSIVELQHLDLLKINGGAPTTDGDQTTFACGDCILVPTSIRNITK